MSAKTVWIVGYETHIGMERDTTLTHSDAIDGIAERVRFDRMFAMNPSEYGEYSGFLAVLDDVPDGASVERTIAGNRYFVMDIDEFLRDDDKRNRWAAEQALAEANDAIELTALDRELDQARDMDWGF